MRAGLGLAGLLVVLAIIGFTAKKQLASTPQVLPTVAPRSAAAGEQPLNVREQGQQVQEQVKQQLEVLTQPRAMPDDAQ